MYTTTTTTTWSSDSSASADIVVALLFFGYIIFLLVAYVFYAICLSKIFKKADTPAWQAWVPFLNSWKMLEIGGQPGYWAVLAVIPFVGVVSLVFMYIAMFNIGKKLGKEDWFILLAIFLPIVWLPWLAFDGSTWDDSKGTARKDTPISATAAAAPVEPVAK